MNRIAIGVACALFVGCGQQIAPLDPHDVSLPDRTRRLVSESEDAVVVARADRRSRRRELRDVERWRGELLEQTDWSAAGLETAAEKFVNARRQLAESRQAQADADLELALAKLELVYAEQSVHLDRANYELKPLRDRVERLRSSVADARKQARAAHIQSEEAASAWWQAYGQRAQGAGAPKGYWTDGAAPLSTPKKKPKKATSEGTPKLANH